MSAPQTTEFNRPPIVPPHLAGSTHDRRDRTDASAARHNDHAIEQQPRPIDGTEEMSQDEQRSAGIIDDAGRKVPPTHAFLLIAMLFIFGIAIVILALVLVLAVVKPVSG
jgi:hypothetical protein